MRPGTVHAVLTLEPSLTQGSHFLTYDTLPQTATWRWMDRISGTSITNTSYDNVELWLHPMMASVYFQLYHHFLGKTDVNDFPPPNPTSVAALLVMISNPQWFIPKTLSLRNDPESVESRNIGTELAQNLAALFEKGRNFFKDYLGEHERVFEKFRCLVEAYEESGYRSVG